MTSRSPGHALRTRPEVSSRRSRRRFLGSSTRGAIGTSPRAESPEDRAYHFTDGSLPRRLAASAGDLPRDVRVRPVPVWRLLSRPPAAVRPDVQPRSRDQSVIPNTDYVFNLTTPQFSALSAAAPLRLRAGTRTSTSGRRRTSVATVADDQLAPTRQAALGRDVHSRICTIGIGWHAGRERSSFRGSTLSTSCRGRSSSGSSGNTTPSIRTVCGTTRGRICRSRSGIRRRTYSRAAAVNSNVFQLGAVLVSAGAGDGGVLRVWEQFERAAGVAFHRVDPAGGQLLRETQLSVPIVVG